MRIPKPVRRAFTLVELLVVIAIIGILATLIMPALSKAIQQANKTSCTNNLRQIGIALQNYQSDFGQFPWYGAGGINDGTKVMGALVLGGQIGIGDVKLFQDKGINNARPIYTAGVPEVTGSNYRMYRFGQSYNEDDNPGACPVCADGAKKNSYHKPGKPVCVVLYQDNHVDAQRLEQMGTTELEMLDPQR